MFIHIKKYFQGLCCRCFEAWFLLNLYDVLDFFFSKFLALAQRGWLLSPSACLRTGTVCQSSDFLEFQGEGREGGVGIPSWLGSASWRNQIIDGF